MTEPPEDRILEATLALAGAVVVILLGFLLLLLIG
jgi:hypothetical protein